MHHPLPTRRDARVSSRRSNGTFARLRRKNQVARDSLRELLGGQDPVITALLAGLECGVIGDKAPGMDMVRLADCICYGFCFRLRGLALEGVSVRVGCSLVLNETQSHRRPRVFAEETQASGVHLC